MASAADIFEEARNAAQTAAEEENAKLPPEHERGLDCGFGWVVIRPARGALVSLLKKRGIGWTRDHGSGGYEVSYGEIHSIATQSISVHYEAAKAFAAVLMTHGLNAYADSRLD